MNKKTILFFSRKEGSSLSLYNLNLITLKIEKKEERAGSYYFRKTIQQKFSEENALKRCEVEGREGNGECSL
jgi:hypothetical protein